jgi:hypothetical protein
MVFHGVTPGSLFATFQAATAGGGAGRRGNHTPDPTGCFGNTLAGESRPFVSQETTAADSFLRVKIRRVPRYISLRKP